jgi:hypothetical protein
MKRVPFGTNDSDELDKAFPPENGESLPRRIGAIATRRFAGLGN